MLCKDCGAHLTWYGSISRGGLECPRCAGAAFKGPRYKFLNDVREATWKLECPACECPSSMPAVRRRPYRTYRTCPECLSLCVVEVT